MRVQIYAVITEKDDYNLWILLSVVSDYLHNINVLSMSSNHI